MRGNEPNDNEFARRIFGFQIPMRGNEICVDVLKKRPRIVSNPHEG